MALLVLGGEEALRALETIIDPWPRGVHVEADEDELRVFTRCDMLHLDADALHDRLHHWTLTEIDRTLHAASARLSFRHALPAAPLEASTLDTQESWTALEPTLALDLHAARPGDIERYAALVPRFRALVDAVGRPVGFRRPDVGNME